MFDDVITLSATEALDSAIRGDAGLSHELGGLHLADTGDGNQQANHGNTPVLGISGSLLEGDGTLANQIEQGLALLSDGCSLLKVRAALLIGKDGQFACSVGHGVTRFRFRIGHCTVLMSTRR